MMERMIMTPNLDVLVTAGALTVLFGAVYGIVTCQAERAGFRGVYILALLFGLLAVLSLTEVLVG